MLLMWTSSAHTASQSAEWWVWATVKLDINLFARCKEDDDGGSLLNSLEKQLGSRYERSLNISNIYPFGKFLEI